MLGSLFARLASPSEIPQLLAAYEKIRYPRTVVLNDSARGYRKVFHHTDGPEQQARDAQMKEAMRVQQELVGPGARAAAAANNNEHAEEEERLGRPLTRLADKRKFHLQYSYDAEVEAERWWTESGDGQSPAMGK